MSFTAWISILRDHVAHVVQLRPEKQVGVVHAWRRIAVVQHVDPFRDRSVVENPHQTMNTDGQTRCRSRDNPVAEDVRARPQQTAGVRLPYRVPFDTLPHDLGVLTHHPFDRFVVSIHRFISRSALTMRSASRSHSARLSCSRSHIVSAVSSNFCRAFPCMQKTRSSVWKSSARRTISERMRTRKIARAIVSTLLPHFNASTSVSNARMSASGVSPGVYGRPRRISSRTYPL